MSCLPCGACVCVCVQRRRLVAQCAERLAEYRHLVHAAATGNADEAAARVSQNLDTLEAGQVSAHLNPSPQPHARRDETTAATACAGTSCSHPISHLASSASLKTCPKFTLNLIESISCVCLVVRSLARAGGIARVLASQVAMSGACCLWLLWRCARRRLCGNGSDAPHLLLHSTRLSFTPSSIIRSERTLDLPTDL